jgi:hypothetical protein
MCLAGGFARPGVVLRYPHAPGTFWESPLKTYTIELQRVKSMSNGHGLINMQIDALVQPLAVRDSADPATVLSLTEDNARVLQALLKAQLTEVDKRKARSQR